MNDPVNTEISDAVLDVMAGQAGLVLEPDWRAGVRANLAASLRMAALVAAFPLGDEAEPLPVFTP